MIVLFRRHVIRRADVGLRQIPYMVKHLADTEISQSHIAFEDEDIGRLKIPMQNFLFMHVEDGECDLRHPVYKFVLGYFFTLHWLNDLIHVTTFAVLHDDIEQPFAVDEWVAVGDDVDVVELL